jgi:hypothetical protein
MVSFEAAENAVIVFLFAPIACRVLGIAFFGNHANILEYESKYRNQEALVMKYMEMDHCIGCPTSSVAQANLTIKINFNILRSFSSSDILTICLHAFLQSLHSFEKNCVQGLPRDFR